VAGRRHRFFCVDAMTRDVLRRLPCRPSARRGRWEIEHLSTDGGSWHVLPITCARGAHLPAQFRRAALPQLMS